MFLIEEEIITESFKEIDSNIITDILYIENNLMNLSEEYLEEGFVGFFISMIKKVISLIQNILKFIIKLVASAVSFILKIFSKEKAQSLDDMVNTALNESVQESNINEDLRFNNKAIANKVAEIVVNNVKPGLYMSTMKIENVSNTATYIWSLNDITIKRLQCLKNAVRKEYYENTDCASLSIKINTNIHNFLKNIFSVFNKKVPATLESFDINDHNHSATNLLEGIKSIATLSEKDSNPIKNKSTLDNLNKLPTDKVISVLNNHKTKMTYNLNNTLKDVKELDNEVRKKESLTNMSRNNILNHVSQVSKVVNYMKAMYEGITYLILKSLKNTAALKEKEKYIINQVIHNNNLSYHNPITT